MSSTLRLYDGYRNNPQLKPEVQKLQSQLRDLGYSVDADGKFGPGTEKAVKEFQAKNGLQTDGIVGSGTRAMLSRVLQHNDESHDGNGENPVNGVLLSKTVLQQIMPKAREADIDKFLTPLGIVPEKYQINTSLRLAHFIAQIAHESGSFRYLEENLNYSADRLLVVFKKYFKTQAEADAYGRKPEKIANRVYASRMGNGDESSGDGWRFRGRGLIQLTGRENYTSFGNSINTDLTQQADLLKDDATIALDAACWFWDSRSLNQYADADDVKTITKRINGGLNGLEDRKAYLERAKAAFGIT